MRGLGSCTTDCGHLDFRRDRLVIGLVDLPVGGRDGGRGQTSLVEYWGLSKGAQCIAT
jgi:hypothetical protein